MSPLEQVWDAVNFFTKSPKYVKIDQEGIEVFTEIGIKRADLPNNKKTVPRPAFTASDKMFIGYQLMASAVNYCYWYGSHNFRPNGANSTEMYKLLDSSFLNSILAGNEGIALEMASYTFAEKLTEARFPLAAKRAKHLRELITPHLQLTIERLLISKSLDEAVRLVSMYPGMSEDVFLKRMSLFFILVHNHLDWFDGEINRLPIPADYQVPKMLRYFGVLTYSHELQEIVKNGELIPSGSRMECEIRASTILAAKMIAEKSGKSIGFVDQYLWGRRKECDEPFHLTITTDY